MRLDRSTLTERNLEAFLGRSGCQVRVVEVDTVHSFYVALDTSTYEQNLQAMHSALRQHVHEMSDAAEVGHVTRPLLLRGSCVAGRVSKDQWWRCRLLQVAFPFVEVVGVDVGLECRLHVNHLVQLPDHLLRLPPLLHHCTLNLDQSSKTMVSLDNINSWFNYWLHYQTSNLRVFVKSEESCCEPYPVDLFSPEDEGISVNQLIHQWARIQRDSEEVNQSHRDDQIIELDDLHEMSRKEAFELTHVLNPSELYVRPLSRSRSFSVFQEHMKCVLKYYFKEDDNNNNSYMRSQNELESSKEFKLKQMVAVRVWDDELPCYFRALILNMSNRESRDDNTFEVYLIDTGNTMKSVGIDDLTLLPEIFQSDSPFCHRVQLDHIRPLGKDWPRLAKTIIEDCFNEPKAIYLLPNTRTSNHDDDNDSNHVVGCRLYYQQKNHTTTYKGRVICTRRLLELGHKLSMEGIATTNKGIVAESNPDIIQKVISELVDSTGQRS